jgi:hypothetical protein
LLDTIFAAWDSGRSSNGPLCRPTPSVTDGPLALLIAEDNPVGREVAVHTSKTRTRSLRRAA